MEQERLEQERLVHLAAGGDVRAFVKLTKRFQHFALGIGNRPRPRFRRSLPCRLAAQTSNSLLCARVLAPGHRHVTELAGGDGEYSHAR